MQNIPAITPEDKIDNIIPGLSQNEFWDQSINLVDEWTKMISDLLF